ncbi:hypothetical protein LXA47_28875, partial [Massilia sp. P8910]|nr:hypothetical protein [Massilia antarctica]
MTENYQIPMHVRLRPFTPWRGGRIAETDVLSLPEAAVMATKHANAEVTPLDFARAAARGEIMLRAVVHVAVDMAARRPDEEPLHMPAGCIPTLPLTACQHLANTGRASWRHVDGHEATEESGGEMWRYIRWELSPESPSVDTMLEDCRVIGLDIHALADAFLQREPHEIQPPPSQGMSTVSSDELTCAMSEQIHNGGPLDWGFWVERRRIPPAQAARLVYCIDPVRWQGTCHSQGEHSPILREKIEKCAALLEDIKSEWTLEALCAYLGAAGAPYGMQAAVRKKQDEIADMAVAQTPPLLPPPPTRLASTSGPVLRPFKYNIVPPDWTRWQRLDNVRLWEAACLLGGFEPPLADGQCIWAEYQTVDLPKPFHEIWEIVNADEELSKLEYLPYSGRMLWHVSLVGFSQWAIRKGLSVPDGMCVLAQVPSTAGGTTPPAVAASQDDLKPVEKKILEIVAAAAAMFPDPLKIPKGGKAKIRDFCMENARKLFGSEHQFDRAWKVEIEKKKPRFLTADHRIYGRRD